MADRIDPTANNNKVSNFLPNFYRTDANKKFLQATIEQLIQPGTVKKVNGYIGRQNAKATTGNDIFIEAPTSDRQNYQLEPGLVIRDQLNNTTFFKDYQDYINQLDVFGANVKNHSRLNDQEMYSWDPHINWDKFVNFQNYYWLPYGPDVIKIAGEPKDVVSTYTVKVESQKGNNAYVFSPNGLTRNPTLKLYRNKTYIFEINSPLNPFSIKTVRSSGGQDRYRSGVSAEAVQEGTIVFTVPYNAPDLLYYVSEEDIDLGGVFEILSIEENSFINVEDSIIGKKTYKLQNGTELSNGMKVSFIGEVTPEEYANKQFYVEGVGEAIQLIDEKILELISPYTESISVLFDTTPFDKLPFSDATAFPGVVDYITINRGSLDRNPWSRYNRWFHKDVIEASARFNGKVPDIDQTARAVRPIIEFEAGLKLFNFGTIAIDDVNLVDNFTKDVFSTIEGSLGYNIDGVQLTKGQRVLFTADTDILVRNKIFRVDFVDVQTSSNELSFNPERAVNTTTDVITLDIPHRLLTGDVVIYSNNGNNSIEGLTSLQTYYVKILNEYSLELYVDRDRIEKVDLLSTIDSGKIYTFYLDNLQTNQTLQYNVPQTDINNVGDFMTFSTAHGFEDGDSVIYRDVSNNGLNYLKDGQTYYISALDDFTVMFYEDPALTQKVDLYVPTEKTPHLFTSYGSVRQIHLIEEITPSANNVVLVKQGITNQGTMYWFDGNTWKLAQQKVRTNQAPYFDVVNENNVSYGDKTVYVGSTFSGTKIFSYKEGKGAIDTNLGFPLEYKNIANIGDIVFDFNLATDSFEYKDVTVSVNQNINVGYLIKTLYTKIETLTNGWQKCNAKNIQAAIRIYKNTNLVNNFDLDIFDDKNNLDDLVVKVYINGIRLEAPYWNVVTLDNSFYKKLVLKTDISTSDVLTIKAYAAQPINKNGYYEIPVNLQNNPLNEIVKTFTLGEVIDHVDSIVDNLPKFSGNFPGSSNIRDLGNIAQYGTKFVQHSGPISLSLYHITSESNNIIKAIEKAKEDYNKFKKVFITITEMLGIDADPAVQVDLVLEKINKDKPTNFPYYFSDMVPYGASIRTEINVLDSRIKSYPLSSEFNLDKLSTSAVLIYLNRNHLVHEKDYTFGDQGFVIINDNVELAENDIIEIYEYENTNGCFIPPTPTKLGLWPKYEPKKYLDTTFINPKEMIQGHDGSLVLAYGDYRDDIILELEKRIFNNIKVKYDPDIFDMAEIIPGYNRVTDYSVDEFNQILAPNFYKWTILIDRDFTKPLSFDRTNSLTFNYRGHSAPDGRPTPGYWRGIYRWMFDTDRPNITPWEMLGFSVQPEWWESVYGPAPYTRDNLILWKDLADGVIRQPGEAPLRLAEYQRPFLPDHIPVDEQGNIISPLMSGLGAGYITPATEGDYIFGDVSPVESAWRRSSHYPFSVLISAMLMKPAKTFGTLLDRSRIIRNNAGQIVYKDSGLRITPKDIQIPSIYSSKKNVQTAGIINYIVDYILSDNLRSYSEYNYNLQNMNAYLTHRIGAFTSKAKFNLLLDSKTPLSSGSVFVPQEDYDIILNSSSPTKRVAYSGVIITKLVDGFDIKGYSKSNPYFYYYPWVQTGIKVNIGGISESYVLWTPEQLYDVGKIVEFNSRYYRVQVRHTTTDEFNPKNYALLQTLPIIGGKSAFMRRKWDRTDPIIVPYGTKFRTIQEVVDFLLGYGEWLKDQGFIFDEFNSTLNAITNWETSAKEFLFWTTQNWSTGEDKWEEWRPNNITPYGSIVRYNGDYYRAIANSAASPDFIEDDFVKLDGLSTVGSSVISLSPAAAKLTFSTPLAVVDDIRNSFNVYEILKVDGTPLEPSFVNSFRENNVISYAPKTEDGIYSATFYLVQKEQVVIINNSTMFNDTIFSPSTGYQQERIKISGYVSSEWNGSFNVPGFIFDQAKIDEWDEWKDYNLGDIVKYKQYYYSASKFIPGAATFEDKLWIKLEETPTAQLLPNWTYKATQFSDFYSLDSGNFDPSQQKIAQHLIGYQKRQYLDNIIKDDVSEYKFYQGMIVEKGTQNVFNKLFDVLSADGKESLTFYEEWAIRIGQYGANKSYENIEFILDEADFKTNPQGFELVDRIDFTSRDLLIRQTYNDVYLKPLKFTPNIWPIITEYKPFLRTPGYVRNDEVKLIVNSIDDLLSEDISQIETGDYVWCGFEGREWNVYRIVNSDLKIIDASYSDGILTLTFEDLDIVNTDDIIGIKNVEFSGFYKISNVSLNVATIESENVNWPSNREDLSFAYVYVLTSRRLSSIDDLRFKSIDFLNKTELLWTDTIGNDKSATWKHSPVFSSMIIPNQFPRVDNQFGKAVVISKSGDIAAVDNINGDINIFIKQSVVSEWIDRQTLVREFISNAGNIDLEGRVLAMSSDNKWLAVGTPNASNATSKYVGLWSQGTYYTVGQIARSGYRYYRALYNNTLTTAILTGTITGTTLTVTSLNAGVITIGQILDKFDTIEDSPLVPGTQIIGFISGTGGAGSYRINHSYSSVVNLTGVTADNNPPALNPLVWEELSYIPVEITGNNSNLTNQGVISIYQRDINNAFTLIDTIISPRPVSNEHFGSSISFAGNTLLIGASGYNDEGIVYQMSYEPIVEATTLYNPVGSDGVIVKVNSVSGIKIGMTVRGIGFTQGQTVTAIDYTNVKITVSEVPDSEPAGDLEFTVLGWQYNYNTVTTTVTGNYSVESVLNVFVENTDGIVVGSLITGYGFYSGQEVAGIIGNQLSLDRASDFKPTGNVTFESLVTYSPTNASENKFGFTIESSNDGNTVAISNPTLSIFGKVSIYSRSGSIFELVDTIQGTEYKFGESISVSGNGEYIVVGSVLGDDIETDQGRVTVYKRNGTNYDVYQVLKNNNPERVGMFGSKVAFMNDYKTLVIFSDNADIYVPLTFDSNDTVFDENKTNFAEKRTDAGRIDIYDCYNSYWIFAESLVHDSIATDGYGIGFSVGKNSVLVSAINADDQSVKSGKVYAYFKMDSTYSWTPIHREIDKVDLKKIKQAFLYNRRTNKLLTYLDVIDSAQGKIPGIADQEIKYKTFYDPAIYSIGPDAVRVDDGMAWTTSQVGTLWWDLRTAKFIDSYTDDVIYRTGTWNTLFPGASIDIYEWVESELTPDEWNELADTEEGLTLNISGTTLYDNNVYGLVRKYDTTSKTFRNTYYYWVKNKKTIPDLHGRFMSALDVANLISNPRASGYKFLELTGPNSYSLVNIKSLLEDKDIVLSVEYWTVENTDQNIHTQWKLISNDVNSKIPSAIEQKWFDSLCGKDAYDRIIPDLKLPIKIRYGIENRPRQGMFVNRFEALKQVVEQANRVLIKYQVATECDISDLESFDPEPSIIKNLYDAVFDTDVELRFSGAGAFAKAILTATVKDGKIIDVTIVSKGNGYGLLNVKDYDNSGNPIEWYGPDVTVTGTGKDAFIKTIVNRRGQITGFEIKSNGYGYNTDTLLTLRNYAVLVHSDTQADGQWSIYSYEPLTRVWSRTITQSFDTRKYWNFVDWYDPNTTYNQFTAFKFSVDTFVDLNTIETEIGDLVKIRVSNNGTWLLLEKYAESSSIDWTQTYKVVGSQNGTIQLDSSLYKFTDTIYGYDSTLFDSTNYDNVAATEMRIILNVLKSNIFTDSLKQEYLNLFFTSVRYALSEQTYLDWAFKTSFIKAQHNVGELHEKVTYNNDNLDDFAKYVSEVKPYRTTVREYVSTYDKLDTSQLSATDFDLPPVYNETLSPVIVDIENGQIRANDPAISTYPWKHWLDNVGFEVIDLKIVDSGEGYISEPAVRISGGNGSGATGRAFIANGKVNRVVLLTPGKGYLSAPQVTIDGGLNEYGKSAAAVAIIGNSVVRSNLIKMKFDRITQTYFITQLQESQSFAGTGSKIQFALTWAPDVRIGLSSVTIDGIDVLRDNYRLATVKSVSRGYTSYSGSITFDTPPALGAVISITYLKDWALLNAADRIQYYYNPESGELGKDLAQLMTGVDYGGVIVDGLDFVVGGGWDMLPYIGNKWDDFEESLDDYVVIAETGQHSFPLPYIPVVNTEINVYYVNSNDDSITRIDDINYIANPSLVTNADAVMETWIGDGESNTIEIPLNFVVNEGDKFILRKSTSDGSIAPKETDYDTALSGGDFTYNTATGLKADDIIVDGDGFVTPMTSPATEEVVPGQVVDAVAIKVYDKQFNSSATIKVDSYTADGVEIEFEITQQPNSRQAIIVKLTENNIDPITNEVIANSQMQSVGVDFYVDYTNRKVVFVNPPAAGKLVTVFSFGFNGENILDINSVIADGIQTQFVTQASWISPLNYLVYVDGLPASVELYDTGLSNRTGIRFGIPPVAGSLISYVIVNSSEQTFSITKSERFNAKNVYTYYLENKVGDALPYESNMIVRVGQQILKGPNNSYFTIENNRLNYTIDPLKIAPYSVQFEDVVVIANGELLDPIRDYSLDLSGVTVKITKSVYKKYSKKTLIISVRQDAGYLYKPTTPPQIVFSQLYDDIPIEITSFYNHNVLDIQSTLFNVSATTSFEPDTIEYYDALKVIGGVVSLERPVASDYYIWIIKDGNLLIPSIDFKLNDDRQSVTLATAPADGDAITMMTFSSNMLKPSVSYMQFKDMLNRTHYKRLNLNKQTKLAKDLRYTDLTIEVEDASNFDLPNPAVNKPGIIEIRGERIEYFTLTGNVLGQLRRGTLGTGTPLIHRKGAYVQDIGPSETIPYSDTSIVEQVVVTDNESNIIELSFVPTKESNSEWFSNFGYSLKGEYSPTETYTVNDVVTYNGYYYKNISTSVGIDPTVNTVWELYISIPVMYGQSNDIEVFVGGYENSGEWTANFPYAEGDIVNIGSYTYRCVNEHTSSASFTADKDHWKFFVGNIRLKKKPYYVHNINNHPESTEGDVYFEPDFSVDGTSTELRLTNKLSNGTRVTVVKRTLIEWDSQVNIQNDTTKIGNFIKAVPGIWYTDIIKYDAEKIVTFDSTQGSYDETDKIIS